MQKSRVRRVFQLRKTSVSKENQNQEKPQKKATVQTVPKQVLEFHPKNTKDEDPGIEPLIQGPQLVMNNLSICFKAKVNKPQVKNVELANVGSSAIHYEWAFQNKPKISNSAIKDPKPKFYSHYQPSVIKPGEKLTFAFSFFSQIPGIYVQECQLICRLPPLTPIPPLKLKAEAYVQDEWETSRSSYLSRLSQQSSQTFIKQILHDVIHRVRSPEPPLPDIENPQIAERQFEKQNASQKLYYDSRIHQWFTELFCEVWQCNSLPSEERYWDQSVTSLKALISRVHDADLRESYEKRLENYCHLSFKPSPLKSQFFPAVRELIMDTVVKVGGDLTDEVKKELEMWEIPFQEPEEDATEELAKQVQEQRAKIKAEWVKKSKKKKWGEQDEKQLLSRYNVKAQEKISEYFAGQFATFTAQASLLKVIANIRQHPDLDSYFGLLERLKTVKQYPLQGKKVLLKLKLKLKSNCEEQLKELEQYMIKKKQEEIRLQQQKSQEAATKKKSAVAKKKKAQKEEQEEKPLHFDFNSILDEEAWNGIVDTLRIIVEKQPFLLVIGCSYGPRKGSIDEKYSVRFLLEHLKSFEPSIQFLPHQQLRKLSVQLEQEQVNEGSIYLTENLNFLPEEVMQRQYKQKIEESASEGSDPIQKVLIKSEKLTMSQIRDGLNQMIPIFDLMVSEDQYNEGLSGITTFGKCEKILGTLWWKYIALCLRTKGAKLVFGGDLTPQKLVTISRMAQYSKIYLTGELGAKVWICKNQADSLSLLNIQVSPLEKQAVSVMFEDLHSRNLSQNIVLPSDFIVSRRPHEPDSAEQAKQATESPTFQNYNSEQQYDDNCRITDVGPQTVQTINQIGHGHLFIIERTQICAADQNSTSFTLICRKIFAAQEKKRDRHQKAKSTPEGTNYESDLVTIFVAIREEDIEEMQLVEKQKKSKKVDEEDDGEQENMQQEQYEESGEDNQKKKIDLIADFRLSDTVVFESLLRCDFNYGLKDMSKYSRSD